MSNPCINRWGLNSFWHHYWFSDTKYALNLQHDRLILELLQTFIKYGSNVHKLTFWNPFWYKKNIQPSNTNSNYLYRWVTMYSKSADTNSTYRLRKEGEEIFLARTSFLKLNSWLIVNFYWFQPDKSKKKRVLRTSTRRRIHTRTCLYTSSSILLKTRTLLQFQLTNNSPSTLPYDF